MRLSRLAVARPPAPPLTALPSVRVCIPPRNWYACVPCRFRQFRSAVAQVFRRDRNRTAVPIAQMVRLVNDIQAELGQDSFSRVEADAMLMKLDEQNRVMYSSGIVHVI